MDLQVHGKSASWGGAAGMRIVHKTGRKRMEQTEQAACWNGDRMFSQRPGGPSTRQAMKQRTRRRKILRACGESAASLDAAMTIAGVRLGSSVIGDRPTDRQHQDSSRIFALKSRSVQSDCFLASGARNRSATVVQPPRSLAFHGLQQARRRERKWLQRLS